MPWSSASWSWSRSAHRTRLDRRPAINLAWEWVALGLIYLLLRNLPRTRDESSALAGVMVATAFAVSVYGLYQVKVELPLIRAEYLRNPQAILQKLGIEPGGRGEEMFRNRLMGSTELFSTFGLANSLAGFHRRSARARSCSCVQSLVHRDNRNRGGWRWPWRRRSFSLLLVCLMLTKSRSAWLGLLVATTVLAWHVRRQVSMRVLAVTGLAGLAVLAALVAAGLKARPLDREVLTQVDAVAPLSLGVLARCMGRDLGRSDQRDASRELAVFLVGRRAGQFWRALPAGINCRSRARRSSTRTTCFSRYGRRPASGLCSRWRPRWHGDSGICSAEAH